VGGREKFQKQRKEKEKLGGGRGENKVKKKNKLRSGLGKGKEKKVNLGWHRDRKENPISAPSIHPRWCTGGCWFTGAPSYARIGSRHYKILISKM
jgi:hypothetical protein